MLNLISSGANYIIMIMCVIYAISCYTVFLPCSDEAQVKRMNRQEGYIFVFHFICYSLLFLKTFDKNVLFLYVVQLIFFKFLIFIYSHFYMDCSRILLNHTCFLLMFGLAMLTRLSVEKAIKQSMIVLVASLVTLVVPVVTEKAFWLQKLRWFYGLLGILFLATVFVLGVTRNGSTNWISIGGIITLQPSEFVKIAFVFFIAAVLAKEPGFQTILVTAVFSAVHVIILVLEKDLGGALLYFVVYIFMSFVATGRFLYLLGGFGVGAGAGRVAYMLFSHVRVRFSAWSNPWADIDNTGYQITQSLFAIGTGSWFGLGFTQGKPTNIPVVDSDFIFSAICEEFGCIVGICVILIYLGIFVHFLKIAMDVEEPFYKILSFGFSMIFIFQVFLTVGGVTKFIPSTGVTLPLISYGGSSVASTLIIFGIMQGVFMLAYKGEEEADEVEEISETISE